MGAEQSRGSPSPSPPSPPSRSPSPASSDEVPHGKACLSCKDAADVDRRGRQHDFCSGYCEGQMMDKAPCLAWLSSDHPEHKDVKKKFYQTWLHNKPRPTICEIYKIFGTRSMTKRHMRYRWRVAKQRDLHHTQGNLRRRWHGTARECRIGEWDKKREEFHDQPCQSRGCAVCAIIRHSFRLERAESRDRTRRSMFGWGIYSSSVSSKADVYAGNTGRRASRQKAIFLCNVVLGKPIALPEADHDFDAGALSDSDADSVNGDPDLIDTITFDEDVVYDEDAIRPRYLVMYE